MHHDHVLKKFNFDLLTQSPGSGAGGGRVLGQNICYHVAAFGILFNLIVLKKLNFDLLTPPPKSTQGMKHRPLIEKSSLICFILIVPLSAYDIIVKILTTY